MIAILLVLLFSILFFLPKPARLIYFLLCLTLLVSQFLFHREKDIRFQRDIVALLDDSPSMGLEEPSRLEQAKKNIKALHLSKEKIVMLSNLVRKRKGNDLYTGIEKVSRQLPPWSRILLFSDGQIAHNDRGEKILNEMALRQQKVDSFPVGKPLPLFFDFFASPLPQNLYQGEQRSLPIAIQLFQAPLEVTITASFLGEVVQKRWFFAKRGVFKKLLPLSFPKAGEGLLTLAVQSGEERRVWQQGIKVSPALPVTLLCGRVHPDCGVFRQWLSTQSGIQFSFYYAAQPHFSSSLKKIRNEVIQKKSFLFLLYPNCQLMEKLPNQKQRLLLLIDSSLVCNNSSVQFKGTVTAALTPSLAPFSSLQSPAVSLRWLRLTTFEEGLLFFKEARHPFLSRCAKNTPQCLVLTLAPLYKLSLKDPKFTDQLLSLLFSLLRQSEQKVYFPPKDILAFRWQQVFISSAYDPEKYHLVVQDQKKKRNLPFAVTPDGLIATFFLREGKSILSLGGAIQRKKVLQATIGNDETTPPAYQREVLKRIALRTGGNVQPKQISASIKGKAKIFSPWPLYPLAFLCLFLYWRKLDSA